VPTVLLVPVDAEKSTTTNRSTTRVAATRVINPVIGQVKADTADLGIPNSAIFGEFLTREAKDAQVVVA